MKRFLQLLVAATLLCGCEDFDSDGDSTSGLKFLDGTEVVPVFTAEGGSATVVFSSDYDWSISASDKWILFSPSSGTAGEAKVLITLTENPLNAERTGTVTITLSNGTTGDITLRQQPFEAPFNQILYTTSDGKAIELYTTEGFGANIVSNTYKNGQGKILFDGDVTAIGEAAFWACNNLTSMIIPNSVTIIKNQAFLSCQNLADFIIPDSVTEIEWGAFRACYSLTNIVIPDSVTTMGYAVFANCSNMERFEGKFASADNRYLIGGDHVFFAFAPAGLTEYTIPDGIKEIGEYTFSCCAELTNITIPAGVTEIGSSAFEGCGSLTSIVIPDSVTEIGTGAFAYCSSLTSITIPAGVTTIGGRIFAGCTNLERFEGKFASADNRCLISDGKLIAFAPVGLTQYTIPAGVTIIGDGAFSGSDLTSIVIPDSVTGIGLSAFEGCGSLTSIIIPDSVTVICAWAFSSCDSLTSIVIPDGVTSIENSTFLGCDSLVDITIPDSVTVICEWAFMYCSSLTNITIPDSVTEIRKAAFLECSSLSSITIPDSITTIGYAAFANCSSLSSVYCKPTTPPAIGEHAFTSLNFIYVPRASVEAYKSAAGWDNYASWIVGYDF